VDGCSDGYVGQALWLVPDRKSSRERYRKHWEWLGWRLAEGCWGVGAGRLRFGKKLLFRGARVPLRVP
jgi:hypothetical protein